MRVKGGSGGGAGGAGGLPSPYVKWERERCAKIDNAKLEKIKPSVDAKSPPRFKHMVVNAKKLQLEEDRLVEIEHQNRKLLDNLSRISERPSGLSGDNGASRGSTARPKALLRGQAPVKRHVTSLNVRKRQEELDRIERENALILRRIRDQSNRESEFSVKKMQSEWKETLEHRKRASQWIG